jgi:CheY-like chemotaxis protein
MDARPAVLVVDDQPRVARAVARVLRRDFRAEATTSCATTLARLRAGERFAAIVCELSMIEMTGVELYEEVRRLAPTQHVLFLSAGILPDDLQAFADAHRSIEKPFVGEPLRERIWEIVSQPVANDCDHPWG